MTGSWAHIGPAMTAAFLASLVGAVGALTIVLAVATLAAMTHIFIYRDHVKRMLPGLV